MLKTTQQQEGDSTNWTPTDFRQRLRKDSLFTIINHIRLNLEGMQKLEQKEKKVVNSMVEEFRNVDTSFEIEDLILRGVLDKQKLMTIMASNPSCSRLFYALPCLKLIITDQTENDENEWGADIKQEKCINEWKTEVSYYYIHAIHQKLHTISEEVITHHAKLNENEIMYFGYAIETLVDHFIQENEVPFAIALLEEGVRIEILFVDNNIYESSEKKHTILYKCGKYLEWCIELHQDGKPEWTKQLNLIEEKKNKFETLHAWDDSENDEKSIATA